MKISDIAEVITSLGIFLTGLASLIKAIKKNQSKNDYHGSLSKVLVGKGRKPHCLFRLYHIEIKP